MLLRKSQNEVISIIRLFNYRKQKEMQNVESKFKRTDQQKRQTVVRDKNRFDEEIS